MKELKNSYEGTPEFSAISAATKEKIPLPNIITWESLTLAEDEIIVYITETGEVQYVTTRPFDENKQYKIILFDYST